MNQHVTLERAVTESVLLHAANKMAMLLLKIGTVIAEILLIAHAATGNGWETLALGHVGIVASLTLVVLLLERARIETGSLQTFTLLTFAGGPVGGAAALLGEQLAWRPRADALESWYDTMAPKEAPAVTLVDLIIDGRLVQQRSRLPRPYDALLTSGTMQEKQALLAYLAIEDDEKFVEVALALALRSSDQRVRVQAAAVAAYTRSRARRRKMGPPASNPDLSPAARHNI